MLSERAERILKFIQQFTDEYGYPPSVRQIQDGASISSTSVVKYNLEKLAKLGYIEHDAGIARGIRVVGQEETLLAAGLFRLPILGRIAAGEPIMPGGSPIGEIALTREIVKEEGELYALEVKGESMIDALVYDGDIVVMKPVTQAHNGDMVAAWLKDREETTLKHFYLEGGRVRLQPANPTMKPIYIDPDNVEIQGKVVAVIRRLH